jgi:cytochrome c peroxidase
MDIRIVLLFVGAFASACSSGDEVRASSPYTFRQPEHFPAATYTFDNNPVTKEGFELGRMLFYDPILSVDSTVSCSTCHKQATGFADPTHRINHGVGNRFGKRNASGIANMAFRNNFFYDGGVTHLDFVPINAITSDVEMGNTLEEVIIRLQRQAKYRNAFFGAFQDERIDSKKILQALAQFTVMIVSDHSKFDDVTVHASANFTTEEALGYAIFQSKCASCHAGPLFTDDDYHNNGLDETFEGDGGRSIVSGMASDLGKFRVPSLRNVTLTPPYMHDGRYNTLSAVIDHYRGGMVPSSTLDPIFQQSNVLGIRITDEEKRTLMAFLETLTDHQLKNDSKFSDPF